MKKRPELQPKIRRRRLCHIALQRTTNARSIIYELEESTTAIASRSSAPNSPAILFGEERVVRLILRGNALFNLVDTPVEIFCSHGQLNSNIEQSLLCTGPSACDVNCCGTLCRMGAEHAPRISCFADLHLLGPPASLCNGILSRSPCDYSLPTWTIRCPDLTCSWSH